MKIVPSLLLLIAITFLSGCLATTSPTKQQTRIDEVPMYGGMDRSQISEIKAADDKFISNVSAQFGTIPWQGRFINPWWPVAKRKSKLFVR